MIRWVIVLLLSASLLSAAPAIDGGERDGDPKSQREKRERKQRDKQKREKNDEAQERPVPPAQPPFAPEKPQPPVQAQSPAPLPAPIEKAEAKKPNVASNKNDDLDFTLQGEYLGELLAGPLAGRAGLQVIALGDGKFEAFLLQGGLPGNGWLRGSPRPTLTGERDGQRATLRGEIGAIEIDGQSARIVDAQNQTLGELKKVLRRSPTLGAAPAAGAKRLFDGTSTDAFRSAKLTDDGLLGVGALTKDPVGDFHMHLEFRTPFDPTKRGQGRGNSGVYIQERYEVQVLDSFGLTGEFNECGALYRQRSPDFNLCLPPLSWQTYDIYFTAARFDAQAKKIANARITVFHNGIAVQDNVELTGKTGAGQKEEPTPRPIRLQDHGNPVAYRNIWLVPGQGNAASEEFACDECP